MKMRSVLLFIILLVIVSKLFGDDLEFVTIRNTILYDNSRNRFEPSRDALFEIDKDIIVKFVNNPPSLGLYDDREFAVILGYFEYNDKSFFINCNDLVSVNTVDTFEHDFITDLNSTNRKTWVPWYFPNVLQAMDRDTVLLYDSYWRNFDPMEYATQYHSPEWYDLFFFVFPLNSFSISNSAIVYNKLIGFIVNNIKKINNGYIVNVKLNNNNIQWKHYKQDDLNWDISNNKEFFDMILILDGDYMDVFLENMDYKLTTFVLVEQALLDELYSLGINKPVDLSRITHWPRRADGSMDYPPPTINNANNQSSSQEIGPSLDSEISLESVSAKTTENSQFPLWLLIGGGLLFAAVGVGIGVVVIVKKRK